MPRRKRREPLENQTILACRMCGTPAGKCEHRGQLNFMAKKTAAAAAIRYATAQLIDYKTKATGEKE
jgi:hypothetical protein